MRMEMRQESRYERLMETGLGMARWVFQRQTELAEALSYWAAINWAITLSDPYALESASSYSAMRLIAQDIQQRINVGGPNEGPWATLFYAVVLVLTIAYALTLWGVFSTYPYGESTPPPWQFVVARRLRIVALIPLAMLLAFISYALWVANPLGSGFRVYSAFALTSLWSAAFIAWRYGRAVLPRGGR